MRQLRLKRRELEEGFQRELLACFRKALAAPTKRTSALSLDESELSLLDNETLELDLAVEGMIGRSRTRTALPRSQLQMRLDYLLRDQQINDDNNPFDPQQVCRAFRQAAAVLELDIKSRLVIFKLFERYVASQLPGLYEEVNQRLIEHGVLPGLKHGIEIKPSAPPTASSHHSGSVAIEQGELAEALHQLLAGQKYGGAPAGSGRVAVIASRKRAYKM
ncbi:hypothetical protein CAI21_07145 [Alkalilimnicola ehrlichii]|uniref:DUF1631 domain-containing protein n=1 Tax=Alkalilimnicola ehrlichii TaxID=351052 RepID=A0A3E0WY52_9GAMM|nr:DUF1631 family protein [Alkalilimnicola ehrlichii]RFA30368.1 hypothetical protein CAI21_07145 [Alkalilimnicola ehrlichii]RFA37940.1 hypothetical protein CAL65_08485 [Alkalilimnicola ehrlichii]